MVLQWKLVQKNINVSMCLCVCGGQDTLPVSLRLNTPSKHRATFLCSTHCNPWWLWAGPPARNYANVITLGWPQDCACLSYGFTFHPHFTGVSALLSALIELTSQKWPFLQESYGTWHSHAAAWKLLTVFTLESLNAPGKRGFSLDIF